MVPGRGNDSGRRAGAIAKCAPLGWGLTHCALEGPVEGCFGLVAHAICHRGNSKPGCLQKLRSQLETPFRQVLHWGASDQSAEALVERGARAGGPARELVKGPGPRGFAV